MEHIEIEPVAISRVQRTLKGELIAIGDDVGGIVQQLQEIDSRFRVHFSRIEGVFVLRQEIREPDGSMTEHLVGAYDSLDGRVLRRAQQIVSPTYDLGAELARIERDADKALADSRREKVGDAADRIGHALRKDLGRHEAPTTVKSRAFIPRAFSPKAA